MREGCPKKLVVFVVVVSAVLVVFVVHFVLLLTLPEL